jgi:hypothetical protein
MRTGADFSYPASHEGSHSVIRREPLIEYMICRSAGSPATDRSSQSRQATASSS